MAEDEEQTYPQPRLLNYAAPGKTDEFLKWITKTDDIIQQTESQYRGERFDPIERKITRLEKPKMNDIGIADIIGFLNDYLSRNTFVSNLKEDEAHRIAYNVKALLRKKLLLRGVVYGVNPADRSDIVQNVGNIIFFALKRPVNQGERELIKSTKVSHELTYSYPEGKPGILGKIEGGLKGKGW